VIVKDILDTYKLEHSMLKLSN